MNSFTDLNENAAFLTLLEKIYQSDGNLQKISISFSLPGKELELISFGMYFNTKNNTELALFLQEK